MLASDIITRAGRLLFDPTHVRWTVDELIDYINDAQRQIVLLVPDANSRNESIQLQAGTRQPMPNNSIRLLRLTRNMGADGETPGRVIYPTVRTALDSEIPDWHTSTDTTVEHYIYDPEVDRTHFYVYPGVGGQQVHVEIVYSVVPATANAAGDELELADQYISPIVDWVLYRCWAKDADYAGNPQRAQTHEQSFYQQLGIKYQSAARVDPNRRIRGGEAMSG